MSNFIDEFHSIAGTTIRERQHNLYAILRNHKNLTNLELDEICANLKPKTHLETIFRIDFLIYFKRINELLHELEIGDEITTRKINKHDWFFVQAFINYSANEFVNEILPKMSYSARCKILTNFEGKNEETNDEIFDLLVLRYGIYRSTQWLTKCSPLKIREFIKNYPEIVLSQAALKSIFEKDETLLVLYCKNHKLGNKHKWLLHYVAKKSPQVFSKLIPNLGDYKLGRRNTRNFIKVKKDAILEKPKDYYGFMNVGSLRRHFGPQSVVFLKALFPRSVSNQNYLENTPAYNLLLEFPKKTKSKTFIEVYNEIFYDSFGSKMTAISNNILEKIFEDPIEREKYAMLKYNKEENWKLLQYYQPETCYAEFTSKMSKMTSQQRVELIEIVTKCCILNKNSEILLKLCDLVANRLKNDIFQIANTFLSTLSGNEELLTTDDHWKLIFQIFSNQDRDEFNTHKILFTFNYWWYLHKQNKNFTNNISANDDKWVEYMHYIFFKKIPDLFKILLVFVLENRQVGLEDGNSYENHRMMETLYEYNNKNPKKYINLLGYEYSRKILEAMLKNESTKWSNTNIIIQTIKYAPRDQQYYNFLNECMNHLENIGTHRLIYIMLKYHPKILQQHFDNVLKTIATPNNFINKPYLWLNLKKYEHLNLSNRIVDFCLTQIQQEGIETPENFVLALSHHMSNSTYRDWITNSHLPQTSKIDMTNDIQKREFQIQTKIIESLTHFQKPFEVLPLIFEFCKGDFLKFALMPLYSNLYRLAQPETKQYINKLIGIDAISVKKHSLFLCCELLNMTDVIDMLTNVKVPNLKSAMRYFIKNPTIKTWQIFDDSINKLTIFDEPCFTDLLNIKPHCDYQGRYFITLYNCFQRCQVKKYINSLLAQINSEIIQQFSNDFISETIEKQFQKNNKKIDNFVVKILLYGDINANWWNQFVTILEQLKTTKKSIIYEFVKKLSGQYLSINNKNVNLGLIKKLSEEFANIFEMEEIFEEYIIFEVMKQKGVRIENLAGFLLEFQLELIKKYGDGIVDRYQSVLYDVLWETIIKNDVYLFCKEVLERAQNKTDYLMVVKFLPNKIPEDVEHFRKYEEIMETMTSVKDLIVKIAFNSYLKDLKNV